MIKLDIQPYCETCTIFKPDVERPIKEYGPDDLVYQSDTIIRCERRALCAGLLKHLKKVEGKT